MEKKPMSQNKKKKKINLNFNFSDDDSGDDFFQPQTLKAVRAKHNSNNTTSPQTDQQTDTTIISSEYSRRQSQLPSFLEDIGPPVMDSTHLFTTERSEDARNSLSTDTSREIVHRIREVETDYHFKFRVKNVIPAIHEHQKENISPSNRKSQFKKSVLPTSLHTTLEEDGNGNLPHEDRVDNDSTSRNKMQSRDSSYSFVEVQDCSIQTSIVCHDVSTKMDKDNLPSKVGDKSNDAETTNRSTFSDQNSSLSSACSLKDHFTTARESSIISDQCTTSESKIDTSGDHVLEDSHSVLLSSGTSSPQELSSYYVQDASLQTSLLQNSSNVISNNLSLYSNLKSIKVQLPQSSFTPDFQTSTVHDNQNSKKQELPTSVDNFRNDDKILHEMFDENSPHVIDKNHHVLAADSDGDEEDISSDKVEQNDSKHSVVIAESEDDDDDDDCDNSVQGDRGADSVSNDQCEETTRSQIENDNLDRNSEISDFQDSGALQLRWDPSQKDTSKNSSVPESSEIDQVTSSLGALSFQTGHSNSRRRYSSSSDDDNFDNFLNKLKVKAGQDEEKSSQAENVPSMDEFIVDDNNSLSSGGENESSHGDDNDNDGNLFYIKTDNERNKKDRTGRRKPTEKTYMYYTSSSCSDISQQSSDSDLSDFIVDDEKTKHKKTTDVYHDFSDPEDEEEEKWSTGNSKEDVGIRKPTSTISNKENIRKDTKRAIKTSNELNLDSPKQHLLTPTKSKASGKNDRAGKPETTPLGLGKKKLLASSFMPSWSDSDSDDDFIPKGKTTPSNFQLTSPRLTAFKTPKPVSKSTSQFKTPVGTKGPDLHPWTAPRGIKHTPTSNPDGDDNTFFLKSLSADYAEYRRHPEAARFVKNFKSLKEDLTKKLFGVFNETIFDSKIPTSIILEWNARYRKTAGTFSYKRNNPNMAKITLSVKVCDRPERVRDTLVHELCHAAVRIVNGVNESHGPVWKSWARKVNKAFPFMPVVARCHDYIIHSKYTYQCVNCKYRIGRHSKSLDTEKKVCGHCKGVFQVFLTSELNNSSSSANSSGAATPRTPRTPNRFAMFVKECYSEVKKKNVDFKHGDIMKELSKEFAQKNMIKS